MAKAEFLVSRIDLRRPRGRNTVMPGPHDIGGHAAGPVDRTEHVSSAWEKRVDAMQVLMGGAGQRLYRLDEMRRSIESLAPDDYAAFGYYERWVLALKSLMIEKDILSADDIVARLAQLRGGTG